MYQNVEFYLRYWYKSKKTIPHIELGLWPRTGTGLVHQIFYVKKKESNRNSCGSPVRCRDTNCTRPVIKKPQGPPRLSSAHIWKSAHKPPYLRGHQTYTSGHKKTTGVLEGGLVEFLCCGDTLLWGPVRSADGPTTITRHTPHTAQQKLFYFNYYLIIVFS